MGSALLQSEHQRVELAISKLGGRAREWALTSGSSVGQAFLTWDELKQQLSRLFSPPSHAYRVRSKFLATRQVKKDLVDYVQELRTLISVFRSHPTSFEEAVAVALNTEYNFKSARMGWSAAQTSISAGPEPMDLSYAED
ncbi:Gag protein [Phytophthora cinnamomi]|uniref:Gag protein n=1 Tax=Phytophthora cinnamomi TaxID=4785 RepID=UPI003559886E|nr:Gag protein [Phytophthora cinnamomi]